MSDAIEPEVESAAIAATPVAPERAAGATLPVKTFGSRKPPNLMAEENSAPLVDVSKLQASDEAEIATTPAAAGPRIFASRGSPSIADTENMAPAVDTAKLAPADEAVSETGEEVLEISPMADEIEVPDAPHEITPEMLARRDSGGASAELASKPVMGDPDLEPEVTGPIVSTDVAHDPAAPTAAAGPMPPPAVDPDKVDTFQPEKAPIDGVNALILERLMEVRRLNREDINARLERLEAERAAAAAELAEDRALDAQGRAAAVVQGGHQGPQSLLGGVGAGIEGIGMGIGALGKALARTITGNPVRTSRRNVINLDREMASLRTQRRVIDRRSEKAINSANMMYQASHVIKNEVARFNDDFSSSPEGSAFLSSIEQTAQKKRISVEEVRNRIHDLSNKDPAIVPLRQQATSLAESQAFGPAMNDIQNASAFMAMHSREFQKNLKLAHLDGVDASPLDEEFESALRTMDTDNAALAKPGGEKLDSLKGRMAELTESMIDAIKAFVARIQSALSFGRRP
jgi:hypothetical protein